MKVIFLIVIEKQPKMRKYENNGKGMANLERYKLNTVT